jgi:RNA polymerase sigma-70 factor (ECF subfamily)
MDRYVGQNDEQLARLAQTGDKSAFGVLVQRHQARVYNIALRLTGDREEALDLAQEAFIRAHSMLASFDSTRLFAPWLARVASNVVLNQLRRRKPTSIPFAEEGNEQSRGARPPPDESAQPEQRFLANEQSAAIRAAILSLPPHYRAVVELRHFQELSYEEIAAALSLPLSDVKSHLFRARKLLRVQLDEGL